MGIVVSEARMLCVWEKARGSRFLWKCATTPPYFASGTFPRHIVFTSGLGVLLCSNQCLEQVCPSAVLLHTYNNPAHLFPDVLYSPLEVRVTGVGKKEAGEILKWGLPVFPLSFWLLEPGFFSFELSEFY